MTPTSFPSGTTAPRSRITRVRALRPSWMVAFLVALATIFLPSTAQAATTPSPTPSALSGTVAVTLAPVDSGTVRAGDSLTAWVTVANGTAVALPAGTATLAIGAEALPDRASLTAWLAGNSAIPAMQEAGSVATAALASGADATEVVTVPGNAAALTGRTPGVYPLRVSVTTSTQTFTSTSAMIVPDDSVATTPVGVVVPITAGPLTAGLLTSDQLSEYTGPDGTLTAQLDAVDGTTAILAIDPAILAAVRVLGSAAPRSALAWVARLDALPNSRFALQFGDTDVAAQVDAGHSGPVQPTSLQAYMSAANFTPTGSPDLGGAVPGAVPTSTPTATPTATAAPGQPVYPTTDELLAVIGARSDTYWPITGTATADVVASLGAQSAAGQRTLTLVPSASTKAGASDAAVGARASVGDAGVLVYDSAISAALRTAAATPETALRAAPLTEAAAYLSFATRSAPGTPLLVTVDRGADQTRLGVRAAIGAVSGGAGVTPATLDQLAAAAPTATEITDVQPDTTRATALTDLESDEARLTAFSSILDTPGVLTEPERAAILQVMGAEWAADPNAWQQAVADHRTATTKTLDAVGIRPPTTIGLYSQGSQLRFWVRNDLPWPVNVTLYAQPDGLQLLVQAQTDVRADAAANTRATVPVTARVGNGEVRVALMLRSPTGVAIGSAQSADIDVRADWENVGLVVISILAAAFVGIGLFRMVRHRRRRRVASETPPENDSPSETPPTSKDDA